jgi:hypothetical protein
MELILRRTDKIVTLVTGSGEVPARIWQGKTSTGIPVHCLITRVAVEKDRPTHEYEEFERELQETEPARPDVAAVPARLIL